jgi:hypothetical protein
MAFAGIGSHVLLAEQDFDHQFDDALYVQKQVNSMKCLVNWNILLGLLFLTITGALIYVIFAVENDHKLFYMIGLLFSLSLLVIGIIVAVVFRWRYSAIQRVKGDFN